MTAAKIPPAELAQLGPEYTITPVSDGGWCVSCSGCFHVWTAGAHYSAHGLRAFAAVVRRHGRRSAEHQAAAAGGAP